VIKQPDSGMMGAEKAKIKNRDIKAINESLQETLE
jgi:hypothetical protein